MAKKLVRMAIAYDFDGTLAPGNMQEYARRGIKSKGKFMAKKLVRMAIAYDFDGTLAPGNMQEYDFMAIAYDFDGTLAPGNMQEYDFIPKLHMNSDDFWGEVKETAKEHDADQILAYMYVMLEKARREKIAVRKSDFKNYGKGIELFDGVGKKLRCGNLILKTTARA